MSAITDGGDRAVKSVIDLIDNVLDYGIGWDVSVDAMRYTPTWDEPIVRDPRSPVEELMAEGYDGYAAQAQVALTNHCTLRDFMLRVSVSVADFEQAMSALAAVFATPTAELQALLDVMTRTPTKPPASRQRPAWQSPYGPARRRR